jgi:hypothetical protein
MTYFWLYSVLDVAYVCRRHHGVNGTHVRVTLDPSTPPSNDDSDVVTVGTPTAWVIIRMLVESPEDLAKARLLQRAVVVKAPPAHPKVRTERAGRATTIAKSGAKFYSELKGYVEIDPPALWHPQLSAEAQAIVNNPASVSADVLAAGVEEGERLLVGLRVADTVLKNNWSTGRNATGFGGNTLQRAVGAKFGLGGHQAIENRSYIAQGDAEGNHLDGTQPLVLCFAAGEMPPCSGFWSLTAYGTDLYLVENEINRWSISDRTPGLVYSEDGSLTITISAERPHEMANWLPVPSGPYFLGMRVYEGNNDVIACSWFPPPLVELKNTVDHPRQCSL